MLGSASLANLPTRPEARINGRRRAAPLDTAHDTDRTIVAKEEKAGARRYDQLQMAVGAWVELPPVYPAEM